MFPQVVIIELLKEIWELTGGNEEGSYRNKKSECEENNSELITVIKN